MTSFFVDPTIGSDENMGTSLDAPFATIDHALEQLHPGDVLKIVPSIIYPPLRIQETVQGALGNPITITSATDEQVVFDAGLRELAHTDNHAWIQVPGGLDEWRTVTEFTGVTAKDRYRYGQFMASRHRLLTYGRIEDFRAANQSFTKAALSDPRLAGGPLCDEPEFKHPWVYMGPGLFFVFSNAEQTTGHIHIRLSHTTFNAPGIEDYTGYIDPNHLALSITHDTARTAVLRCHHVVFERLTFQNGGETTVAIHGQDLVFDHCCVYGAQFGIRIGKPSARLKFRHCLFDGGLAPYTTRGDVKSDYQFCVPGQEPITNNLANPTSDMLVILSNGPDTEFAYCTFRHGHDGIIIGSPNVDLHHCLFEDLNDESVQFLEESADPNIRIHENLFRQVLHPISFTHGQTGGPIYIYRNVIDQRVPTRGYRTLPPDLPEPRIWRYGTTFKFGDAKKADPIKGSLAPSFNFYQNTVISSDQEDKGSLLSLAFFRTPVGSPPRRYLNNLHVGLDLNWPFSCVVPGIPAHFSDGNLWYAPHKTNEILFRLVGDFESNLSDPINSLAELAALGGGWEAHSVFDAPQFVDFTFEYFDYQVPYPSNDFNLLSDTPGWQAGVPIPGDWPDLPPLSAVSPNIGALRGQTLAVGVDADTFLPIPNVPKARAGGDREIIAAAGAGSVVVDVNGSESSDPTGTPLTFRWLLGETVLATDSVASFPLPVGEHHLRLEVRNLSGHTDTDCILVKIRTP